MLFSEDKIIIIGETSYLPSMTDSADKCKKEHNHADQSFPDFNSTS